MHHDGLVFSLDRALSIRREPALTPMGVVNRLYQQTQLNNTYPRAIWLNQCCYDK